MQAKTSPVPCVEAQVENRVIFLIEVDDDRPSPLASLGKVNAGQQSVKQMAR